LINVFSIYQFNDLAIISGKEVIIPEVVLFFVFCFFSQNLQELEGENSSLREQIRNLEESSVSFDHCSIILYQCFRFFQLVSQEISE